MMLLSKAWVLTVALSETARMLEVHILTAKRHQQVHAQTSPPNTKTEMQENR